MMSGASGIASACIEAIVGLITADEASRKAKHDVLVSAIKDYDAALESNDPGFETLAIVPIKIPPVTVEGKAVLRNVKLPFDIAFASITAEALEINQLESGGSITIGTLNIAEKVTIADLSCRDKLILGHLDLDLDSGVSPKHKGTRACVVGGDMEFQGINCQRLELEAFCCRQVSFKALNIKSDLRICNGVARRLIWRTGNSVDGENLDIIQVGGETQIVDIVCREVRGDSAHLSGGLVLARIRGNLCSFDLCRIGRITIADCKAIKAFSFNQTEFTDALDVSAQTLNAANFAGARFKGPVYFNNAHFCSDVDFESAAFSEEVSLEGALFDGSTNFFGATFERPVRASPGERRAKFPNFLPDFTNAKFAYPLDFDGIRLPPLKATREADIKNGYKKYDVLSRLAAQQGDAWWQQEFVSLSFRSRRPEMLIDRLKFGAKASEMTGDPRGRVRGAMLTYVIGPFYGLFSDYGRSTVRPLVGLMVFMIIWSFGTLLAVNLSGPATANNRAPRAASECGLSWLDAAFIAFRNGMVLAEVKDESIEKLWTCAWIQDKTKVPASFKQGMSLSLFVHKILSVVLWFFLGLGVKFQLRMK